jgi:hypothetical protein
LVQNFGVDMVCGLLRIPDHAVSTVRADPDVSEREAHQQAEPHR